MSWKDCDCGMARIRAEIERCSTCEIAAHKDEQITTLTRERDEARELWRREETRMREAEWALDAAGVSATAPMPPGVAGCQTFSVAERIGTLAAQRDEARDELDGIAEVLDEASVPQGADGPDGRRWTLGLGARVEHVIAERDEARAEVERLRAALAGEGEGASDA